MQNTQATEFDCIGFRIDFQLPQNAIFEEYIIIEIKTAEIILSKWIFGDEIYNLFNNYEDSKIYWTRYSDHSGRGGGSAMNMEKNQKMGFYKSFHILTTIQPRRKT